MDFKYIASWLVLGSALTCSLGVQALELSSPAFDSNGIIPDNFLRSPNCGATGSGTTPNSTNASPPLYVKDVPTGATHLAVIMDSVPLPPANPAENGAGHWVIWNLPADTVVLPYAMSATTTLPQKGDLFSTTDQYSGPCPLGNERTYRFRVLAFTQPVTTTFSDVNQAMRELQAFAMPATSPSLLGRTSGNAGQVWTSPTVPPVPDITQVIADDAQVSVTVQTTRPTPSISDRYVIVSEPEQKSCLVETEQGGTCTITGLNNGTPYTVTTRAFNGLGMSDASNASVPVTPQIGGRTLPETPDKPVARPGNARAWVYFTVPTGSTPAQSYQVVSSPDQRSCTATTTNLSCMITGLTNGTPYMFRVTAINPSGNSLPSAFSDPVTPSDATTLIPEQPEAPWVSAVNATQAQARVILTTAGILPDFYTVTAVPNGASTPAVSCTVTPPDTECTLTPLIQGQGYSVTVVATLGMNDSRPSRPTTFLIPNLGGSSDSAAGIPTLNHWAMLTLLLILGWSAGRAHNALRARQSVPSERWKS